MKIQKLKAENIRNIVSWCETGDADFLTQWTGRGYQYPLTEEQIATRLSEGAEIYEAILHDRMVGTIEIMKREEAGAIYVGRFIINPALTGQGLGSRVLETFMAYCKEELGLKKIRLAVFDYNVGAHKCYLKCGFSEVGTAIRPNGWKVIEMEREM